MPDCCHAGVRAVVMLLPLLPADQAGVRPPALAAPQAGVRPPARGRGVRLPAEKSGRPLMAGVRLDMALGKPPWEKPPRPEPPRREEKRA